MKYVSGFNVTRSSAPGVGGARDGGGVDEHSHRNVTRQVVYDIICPAVPAEHSGIWKHHIPYAATMVFPICIGMPFDNELALRILRHGISGKVIGPLSHHLNMGKGELVGILDLDRSTAKRFEDKDKSLPTHAAENVLRLLELESLANDTFETEEAALQWLRKEHPMLEGESPLESAKTSFGARRVKDILIAIKYGGVV